ncbi:uncharacterized protein BO72DRAFT_272223 [Aspergillus fijiensis CBS 313.89]|uniref:Uncharacterized protein n=1 Tax=Aspergillus fijiensis CBS 313.89 TaxID=1448319 RepID=A0A8G1RHK3_9EURO|nr:uncharacterized protein BO72DRAFT_272223 [Aspergillus fijiensis CBS 313.89]RAK72537.1 hypothetical protein BO72DRAFT_272223 [Aspergillus fijiensis CBS 313.89]
MITIPLTAYGGGYPQRQAKILTTTGHSQLLLGVGGLLYKRYISTISSPLFSKAHPNSVRRSGSSSVSKSAHWCSSSSSSSSKSGSNSRFNTGHDHSLQPAVAVSGSSCRDSLNRRISQAATSTLSHDNLVCSVMKHCQRYRSFTRSAPGLLLLNKLPRKTSKQRFSASSIVMPKVTISASSSNPTDIMDSN